MNDLATNTEIPSPRPTGPETEARDQPPLSLAVTGYVSDTAGSVSGGNAVLLRELLRNGHKITFGSKPWYVDPRPIVAGQDGEERFRFVDCTNSKPDRLNRWASASRGLPGRLTKPLASLWDNHTYRTGIPRRLSSEIETVPDACLWLGTWAGAPFRNAPTISWAQGPPGTDARSIVRHREEIIALGGRVLYSKLRAFAAWRLGLGLPRFSVSDHLIVGSEWSRQTLQDNHRLDGSRVHKLPYPIDLNLFRPPKEPRHSTGPLRVMWLGRFVPRKRLPLFLDGIARAIQQGVDVEATVVGRSGFVPNYERFLENFPYRDRLDHVPSIPRVEVPQLMAHHDLLIQPSDDENFGSSVAEAQACGMPVIVGATNGTGDYICGRSVRLADDRVETLAEAIAAMAQAKQSGELADGSPCRRAAQEHCSPASVVARLEDILRQAIAEGTKT